MIKIITSKAKDKEHLPFFKINHRVDIFLPNAENPRVMDAYPSRIENITAEGMSLALPMAKGFPILMNKGEKFIGRMPLAGAAYEFTCVYIDKEMAPLPVWLVSLPYDIMRNQQRQFVRYDISLPVTLEFVNPPEQEDVGKLYFMKTKDISAGGFKIISKMFISKGARVLLTFELPLHGEITVSAVVIRAERPQKNIDIFWVALQFIEITPKERDAIVQFIFKKQLEDRRKFTESKKK